MTDRPTVEIATPAAALRNLANKLLGRLWWCLQNNQPWDDEAAWAQPSPTTEPVAA